MASEVIVRFALAIVLDAFAFVVWDVGTRPPTRLLRDIARGVRVPTAVGRGTIRFLIGALLLLLAAFVARPAMPSAHAFTVLETGMLIAALIVEALIGADLRRSPRSRAASAEGRNAKDSAAG